MTQQTQRIAAPPASVELTDPQFRSIAALVYRACGINLQDGKQGLVKTRLTRRLHQAGVADFDEYLAFVEADRTGSEMVAMLDAITTNKTSFFRESQHFDFVRQTVLPAMPAGKGGLRIWSAGCSTGEEPYSLAILLQEECPGAQPSAARILATDLSTQVLARAKQGVYDAAVLADMPAPLLQRYFDVERTQPTRAFRVNEKTRSMIRFARLNLMEPWPMQGPFDLIFCRNVMIYFDRQTQERLVKRYWQLLRPGGFLFVGHSESLTSLDHAFRYVQPAVYEK